MRKADETTNFWGQGLKVNVTRRQSKIWRHGGDILRSCRFSSKFCCGF